MAQLHPYIQRAIARVRAKGATVDPIADFDALDRINQLAAALDHPPISVTITELLEPVRIGRLTLHPLSLAAEQWIEDHAQWFMTSRDELLIVAWCMCHPGRDFYKIQPAAARVFLRAWAATIRAPVEALECAVNDILERNKRKSKAATGKPDKGALAMMIGALCQEYGRDPEYWLFDVPAALTRYMCDADIYPRNKAREQAMREADKKIRAPDPTSYEARAFHDFIDALREWEKQKTSGDGETK